MILFYLFQLSISYTKSEFGYTGIDTIQCQESDSLVVLQTLPKPKIKFINESGATDEPIPVNDYGWPGHNKRVSDDAIKNETEWVYANFKRVWAKDELNDSMVYAHPAGVQQFYADASLLETAERVKVRFFMNTRYQKYHQTSIYMPPGEIITIEIPEKAKRVFKAVINRHVWPYEDNWGITYRLPRMEAEISLPYTVNKISWPYGGNLIILCDDVNFYTSGIDVNITGGIRMPYFKYGVTTDQEWEETIRQYPAPLMVLDNGAIVVTMPSYIGRHSVRVNDAMAWWRTASRVSYSVNEVYAYWRRGDGRIITPIEIHLDPYVKWGAAFALTGRNLIQMPPSWGSSYVDYEGDTWGCWGNIHEYNHHFQQNWGAGDRNHYGEVTNNAINLIAYTMLTQITETRRTNTWEGIAMNGDWAHMTHVYSTINMRDLLAFYCNFGYQFGADLWRKILHKHTNSLPLRSRMGYHGEFLLNLCEMSGRDVRPYYKQYHNIIQLNWTSEIKPIVHEMIDNMSLPELHPVATIYQTGYIFNGMETDDFRPFIIPAWNPYRFDFEKFKRSANGCHEFDFVNVTGGVGRFQHISGGKYWYTPPKNVSFIDKFYVNYRDRDNGRITTCIVKVRQRTTGHNQFFMPYNGQMDRWTAYPHFIEHFNEANHRFGSAMKVENGDNGPWLGLSEGVFIPPKNDSYRFLFIHYNEMLFYLSEKPLTGNMTEDRDYLLAESGGFRSLYNERQYTKWVNLIEGKPYYFRFFIVSPGKGRGSVAYINKAGQSPIAVTADQTRFPNFNDADKVIYKFIPRLENDPTLGHFYEGRIIKYDSRGFKVTGNFETEQKDVDLSAYLGDMRESTTKPTKVISKSLPLTYDIDMGSPITFDRLYIPTSHNNINGNISVSCDGKEIYNGVYKRTLDFTTASRCTKLSISVLTNTYGNTASICLVKPLTNTAGKTDNIIPATHTKFKLQGSGELSNEGIYYNGKGWHLRESAKLSAMVRLNSTGNSIVILGDRHRDYGGGVFDVYFNGELHGTVNTSFIHPDYHNKMATNDWFQMPLYYIANLDSDKAYKLDLVVRSGQVEIAGLLANGDIIDEIQPTPTPKPTPDRTPFPVRTPPPATASPNGGGAGQGGGDPTKDQSNSKTVGIVIGVIAALVVIGAVAAGAVFYIKYKKASADDDDETNENTDFAASYAV